MVYHPQTNGLSERKNQWVEQFLRLVASNQEEWSTALPLATLVHNNFQNATIRTFPNQLLIGLEPPATLSQAEGASNPLVEQRVRQLRERQILATQALNQAANSHAPTESRWKKGQEVWLEAKNLSLPYRSVKLALRRHGPFRIKEVVSLWRTGCASLPSGPYTPFSTPPSLPPMCKQKNMERTIQDPHLTLSTTKNNTRSRPSEATDVMGRNDNCSIS